MRLLTTEKGFRVFGLILAIALGLGLTTGLRTALASSQVSSQTALNDDRDNKQIPSASFSVNTTQDNADSNPGDGNCFDNFGNCSLRAAIEESNALPGKDTILLPANTYIISSQLTITDSLIIYGSEALNTIIDAQTNSRVFLIKRASEGNPVNVSVFSVTLKNGHATDGAGIWNSATLTISNCVIVQNAATEFGGGISTFTGTLIIINSAIVSNTSEKDGGGLYTFNSIVTATNTTLSTNIARTGRGGGIYTASSEVDMKNTTIANNTANYTVGPGGGGVYIQSSSLKATNTILAENTDQSSAEQHPDCSGILTSNGYNLIEDVDGCSLMGILTGIITNTNALLDSLSATFTQALLKNSPAINHGNSTRCPATDQRGFERRNGYCDIGAFEAQPVRLDAVAGSGQYAEINTPFSSPLQTSAQDWYGNALAGVTVMFSGPATGPGISNSGETKVTHANGLTSFTPVANGLQGSYVITVSHNTLNANYNLTNVYSSTTRILSDQPDPSPTGQPFVVRFTVTSTVGMPSGFVTITVKNFDETCSSDLVNGAGSCSLSLPTPGGYTLIATYHGNATYMGSSASEIHQVNATVFLPLVIRNYMPPSIFGVEFQSITSSGGLEQISTIKPTWTRKNGIQWSAISPTHPTERKWANVATLEGELRNAAANGLETILIVRSTPIWAQQRTDTFCGPIKADSLDEFANFLTDLVLRYSVAPYHVKYWELWNEPDVDPAIVPNNAPYGCWGNPSDPYFGGGYYAEMLKVAYPAIKAADPNAKVLIGGLLLDCNPQNPPAGRSCIESKFLEGILKSGGEAYFDGISFHAYDYYAGVLGQYQNPNWHSAWNASGIATLAKASYITNVLDQYNVSSKFLMNTETAILCDNCQADSNYEQTKAYYITHSYATALSQGLQANVWFSAMGWRSSGLLDDNFNPLPAYHAFGFARREIGNTTFIHPVLNYDLNNDTTTDVVAYTFKQGNKEIWLIWSRNGEDHAFTFPAPPSAAYDVFGNPLTVDGNSLNIGIAPIYLEWIKP